MKQADLDLNLTTERTRKREFLAQMERAVPWPEALPPQEFDRIDMFAPVVVLDMSYSDCP